MSDTFIDNYDLRNLYVEGKNLTALIFLPDNLIYFDGHFDDMPILPGVVQLHWAIGLACDNLNVKGVFVGVNMLKFKKIICPGYLVTIIVSYNIINGFIDFNYSSDNGDHSVGQARFA